MRTTITLDDDVAAKLDVEVRRTGRSFKAVVNDVLRLGFLKVPAAHAPRFRVEGRPLGRRAGLSYDKVQDLLDTVDGVGKR